MADKTTFTPGPWRWIVEDYSMANLQGPNGELDHVLSSSPCEGCVKHAKQNNPNPEWQWARCTTPSEANALLIAAAPEMYDALEYLIQRVDPDNCGDHCDNACPWCEAKRALAKAVPNA